MFSITAEPECLIIFSLISLWYQKNCYLCFHISLGQKSWDPWRYLNAASHIQIRPEVWSMLVQNLNNLEDLRQSPHNLSRAYTKFGAGQKNPTQTNTQKKPQTNKLNSILVLQVFLAMVLWDCWACQHWFPLAHFAPRWGSQAFYGMYIPSDEMWVQCLSTSVDLIL